MSVHVQYNRVEFRSPGGDYLNADITKIQSTIARFIVALDASCDPNKYRQQYLKKLYTFMASLNPQQGPETSELIVKYLVGDISKEQLIAQVKQREKSAPIKLPA